MSHSSYPCGFRPQLGRAPRRAVSVCLRSSVEDSVMRKLFDCIRTHAKKCVAAVAVAFGFVAPALAEGGAGAGPDLSAATSALTTLKDALVGQNGWISSAAPILALLLGGILVITLIWVAYKWVSRGAKKAG